MKDCEYHETQLSAWLDAELDRAGQMELLDHLVFCESCRRFHAKARMLDGLVAAVRAADDSDAPPAEIWTRIQQSADRQRPQQRSQRRPQQRPRQRSQRRPSGRSGRRPVVPVWALRAAAVLVLAVGLGAVLWFGAPRLAEPPAEAIVELGTETGQMTDDRFVELTQELLRAGPRYRVAMFRVMEQVMRDTGEHEASIEYEERPDAAAEGSRADGAGRLPV
jgi:hypothetical protein